MLVFDIDGVVADIAYFCAKDIAEYAGCEIADLDMSQHCIKINNGYSLSDEIIFHLAVQTTVKYVDVIQPHKGSIEFLLDYSQHINSEPLIFLTARKGEGVEEATHKWLKNHLQFIAYKVYFEEDKLSFLKQNKQYTGLVEDRFKTANLASEVVKSFLVTRPWNVGRIARDNVIRIDKMYDIWKHIEI